jgi:hypothetical protein
MMKAANKLHHCSVRYVGAFAEVAQGKGLIALPKDWPGLSVCRDFIDMILFTRAEISALTHCLVESGHLDHAKYVLQCKKEYDFLCEAKAKQLGFKVDDDGLVYHVGGDGASG